ncbi:hypothetical protein HYW54_04640 [Candidatus Gottesmanbacteria bacterium]|nr:hypothetical protein [Candidatus Gottesmanbacteria bacterium]
MGQTIRVTGGILYKGPKPEPLNGYWAYFDQRRRDREGLQFNPFDFDGIDLEGENIVTALDGKSFRDGKTSASDQLATALHPLKLGGEVDNRFRGGKHFDPNSRIFFQDNAILNSEGQPVGVISLATTGERERRY